MDNQKFGISQFAEQVNYQRSIEGELTPHHSGSECSGVSARVHLAIPRTAYSLREQQNPPPGGEAQLNSGRLIDPTQIHGIMNLVASAVPACRRNITIVDQEGNMLSTMGNQTSKPERFWISVSSIYVKGNRADLYQAHRNHS